MRQVGEFIGGGPADGAICFWPFRHGHVITFWMLHSARYRWDAMCGVWRFAGWLIKDDRPPKRKYDELGETVDFYNDTDGYQDR